MKFKRFLAWMLVLLMIWPGMASVSGAETTGSEPGFNIVIVTDNSKSLIEGNTSDPFGHRHQAIRMFLSLLSDSGNYVSAIVFNSTYSISDASDATMRNGLRVNTPLEPLVGAEGKEALMAKITSEEPYGCTDIGTALLAAAEKLNGMTEKNGRESMIILFTDGITETNDMLAYPDAPDEDLPVKTQSIRNREKAIQMIQENGIKLCGVYLSGKRGKLENSEVLDIVRRANNCDDDASMNDLDELYIPVQDPVHLLSAYEKFYTLLTNTKSVVFSGEKQFTVPKTGLTELSLNLSAYCPTKEESKALLNQTAVTIIDQNGNPLDIRSLDKSVGDTFAIYKLQSLEPGVWTIRVNAPAGAPLESRLIFGTDVSPTMTVTTEGEGFARDELVTVRAQLLQNGTPLENESAYDQYNCVLQMMDTSTDQVEESPMTYQSETNSYVISIPAALGQYHSQVVFRCGSAIQLGSVKESWHIKNHPPVLVKEVPPVQIVLGLFTPGTAEVDLKELATDREDPDELTIIVNTDNYIADAVSRDNDVLTIDGAIGGSGSLLVTFTDTNGASVSTQLEIEFVDRTGFQLLMIVLVLALIMAAVLFLYIQRRRSAKLSGELVFEIPVKDATIPLKLVAQTCLHRSLYDILRQNILTLYHAADLRNCDRAAVDSFLNDNKRSLSSIRIGSVHNKKHNTDLCHILGLELQKSETILDDHGEIAVPLEYSSRALLIRYDMYN